MKTLLRQLSLLSVSLLTLSSTPAHATLAPAEKISLQEKIRELKLLAANAPEAAKQVKNPQWLLAPAPQPKTATPATPAAPAAEGAADAAAELPSLVEQDAKDDLERTFLRKNGFAVNLGYGYFTDLRNYAPDMQLRYNFFQRIQTADKITEKVQQALPSNPLTKPDFFAGGRLTDFSGWIGYPLQKLENRDRVVGPGKIVAAGTVKESPLMIGVGFGLGGGPEFSSAISINLGLALFKDPAFKRNQLYVGVSVDAVLFKAMAKAMGSAAGN